MSLLEDVFLEDEAGEAQELERIIEGDEYDDRPRAATPDSNENSEKEDEAEEDKRKVDPTSAKPKRVVKNPRVTLNPARLTGPRGIHVIPDHFKNFTFKGKGKEKEDLDLVLKKLEHWAYRLYPRFEFKDCLKKIETLGNKRAVMVQLTKIRTDQFLSEETVVQRDSSDDEATPAPDPVEDEFDKLLQQQIELARATPTPGTVKKGFTTPSVDRSLMAPKATSSPSINDEQRERMLRSRQMAEERRLARLKLKNNESNVTQENSIGDNSAEISNNKVFEDDHSTNNKIDEGNNQGNIRNFQNIESERIENAEESLSRVKTNRSNVIDSDSEDDGLVINESVTVDVHSNTNYDNDEMSDVSDNNKRRDTVNNERKDINSNTADIIENLEIINDEHQTDKTPNDSGHSKNNEDRDANFDKLHQNDNEEDLNVDEKNHTEHTLNKVEQNTATITNNENESELSNLDEPDENAEVAINLNDVEMDEIDKVNELRSNKTEESVLNKSDTSSKNMEPDIEEDETSTNETLENYNEKLNSQTVDETNEMPAADINELMEVDFSEEF